MTMQRLTITVDVPAPLLVSHVAGTVTVTSLVPGRIGVIATGDATAFAITHPTSGTVATARRAVISSTLRGPG